MVTTNYKGVIIISIKTKTISVILAVIFVFAGAIYAFADEPNAYSLKTTASTAAQTNFNSIEPIETALGKNSFVLTADKVTDNSVHLNWNSDKLFICYKVCKYNVLTSEWEEYLQTNKSNAKIKKLSADTNYRFCVLNAATNEVLGAIQITTAAKRPELAVKEKTSNSIVLSLGSHAETETVMIYRKSKKSDFEKIAEVTGEDSYTDSELDGNQTYYYKAKTVFNEENRTYESAFSKTLETKTLLSMGLPSVSGATKTYAIYTAVTARRSPQYKLLHSEKCTTDEETGIRMYDGCYCVALGSFYGTKIGTKYRITFSSGNSINVILCDQKANRHTDSKHQYAVNNKDIVEFYVQKNKIPKGIRGDYGRLPQFSGRVVSIEKYVD